MNETESKDGERGQALRSVLVATDFSTGAERAVRRALLLPLAQAGRLHVIHVLPGDLPAKVRAKAEAKAERVLARMLSRASVGVPSDRVANLTSEILVGEVFVEIIRCSRRRNADLVVLGRHGQRPIRDLFIGTTAMRVTRKGDVPVLVVKLKPTQAYRRPLITTDLGDVSHRTFELALRVLGPGVRNINVVHAFNVPFEGFLIPTFSAHEQSDYQEAFQKKAVADLSAFLATYKDLDLRWKTAVRVGDPRSVVLREAARRRSDLIAIGTHARAGIAHFLLGSVAEWVLTSAPCDVLVARPIRFSFKLP